MTRYVAFLRAINTPPRYVKMNRLRDAFAGPGVENVATFIASGNVIFDSDEAVDDGFRRQKESRLHEALGFAVPMYLRSAAEVIDISERRPFGDQSPDAEVSFLPARPDPVAVEQLVASARDGDRLEVIGREVYWYHPGPSAESAHKETTVVKILGMETTRRSMRTVARIADGFLR